VASSRRAEAGRFEVNLGMSEYDLVEKNWWAVVWQIGGVGSFLHFLATGLVYCLSRKFFFNSIL